MSSVRNNKKSVIVAKPYCKVCHDAGKTEKEYTSHYVRASPDPTSAVVCPTLLAQPCGFCAKGGHTPSYCPEIAKRKKTEEKIAKKHAYQEKQKHQEEQEKQQKPGTSKKITNNAFAAFDDSDSEDEKPVNKQPQVLQQITKVEKWNTNEFPELPKSATGTSSKLASASAKKPAPSFLSALQQFHPELKVPSKMSQEKFVNSTASYKETIVINKKQHEAREEREQEKPLILECNNEEDNYEEVSAFYGEAIATFKRTHHPPAHTLDWAAKDEESSDEEDW